MNENRALDRSDQPERIKPESVDALTSLVDVEQQLLPGTGQPLVIQPARHHIDLADWASQRRPWITDALGKYGAVLFRGFGISSVTKFDQVVRAVSDRVMQYRERSSPRSQVSPPQLYIDGLPC